MIIHGDCIERMQELPAESIDACITDPPYGLEFMGKEWDSFKETGQSKHFHNLYEESESRLGGNKILPRFQLNKENLNTYQLWCQQWATEVFRVLKPGAYLLAMGGTRTYHRLVCGIEDAGFEIRDCLCWQYHSGFPKSFDASKGFDRAAGVEREEVEGGIGKKSGETYSKHGGYQEGRAISNEPVTDLAKQWHGWGTALKPAWEPIVVARKPLCGTVCENVERHGVGGMNIDACRIPTDEELKFEGILNPLPGDERTGAALGMFQPGTPRNYQQHEQGRWPANILRHAPLEDGSDKYFLLPPHFPFLIVPKPSAAEKNMGLEFDGEMSENTERNKEIESINPNLRGRKANPIEQISHSNLESKVILHNRRCKKCGKQQVSGSPCKCPDPDWEIIERKQQGNFHPTVKPVELMIHLIKLVTPQPAMVGREVTVLDPFIGSGTLGIAAKMTGRKFIGIERELDYIKIARARIDAADPKPADLRSFFG